MKCSVCSPRVCGPASLYVVFDPLRGASKVGMSERPVRRYAVHRKKVGKHVELVAFFPAGCIFETRRREDMALAEMAEKYPRIRGDWFFADKHDAVEIIRRCAQAEVRF